MITIVNYGLGNLGSIQNMLKRIGIESKITEDINDIRNARKLILPGVGAFDIAMKSIIKSGLKETLDIKVLQDKIPILGICLGMQLLTNGSEEGVLPGLGWIDAVTVRFNFSTESSLKVPHMGWNLVREINPSPLTNDLPEEPRFYFVHSYYVKVKNPLNCLMQTHYGQDFDSVIQSNNIFGAQFHPEKSHKYGMKFLENFAKI